jgi:hypothetical protein
MKGFVTIQNDILESKEMLRHLDDEYRKANISEKDYKAMKEKYSNGNMSKKEEPKEEEIQEITPEVIERLANQLSQKAAAPETQQKKEKKPGLFSNLFGKKKKEEKSPTAPPLTTDAPAASAPAPTEAMPAPEEEAVPVVSESVKKLEGLEAEIEKLKTIMETVRETGHVTDETIQTMSESIGELRSLVFQTDASLKETMVKMEKIEDDISQVKPKEIDKKFKEIDADTDRKNIEMEKFQAKVEDSGEKLSRMYEMLKSIGGLENLVEINKKIQEKLRDVDEAVKYIGRIGAKTEKQFMDLSKGMEDLIIFKARQEDLDESLRDILKSIDSLNVRFEGYVSKKDLDSFREELFLTQKQVENLDKVLPMVNEKLPDEIVELRKEREDIQMLLSSLQEQFENRKISKSEYLSFKDGNEKRIAEIEKQLEKEWRKVQKTKKPESETPVQMQESPAPVEQKAPTEDEKKVQDVKEKMQEVKEVFEKKEEPEEAAKEEPKKAEPAKEKKPEKPEAKKVEKPKHKKHKTVSAADNGKMRMLRNIKKMKV